MAVKFSSWGNHQFVIPTTGAPASGYKLKTYVAGSSTPVATYTTSAGDVSQGTTITLNSAGFPTTGQIWILEGTSIKIEFTDPSDVVLKTEDNISGVNDAVLSTSEWMNGPAPSFISTTSFSLVGDQTSTFHVGRRVKTTNSGGTIYSRISVTAYTTLTTVTVVNDSGVLDSGLSAVEYGILSATNFAIPKLTETNKRLIDLPGLADANTWTNTQILSGTLTMSGKSIREAQATIAAATTTDILGAAGNTILMTGNSPITITSFGTSTTAGAKFHVTSTGTGAHILTYNATSMILESADSITVSQGDSWWVEDLGSNNCRVHGYTRANGQPVAGYPASQGSSWTLVDAQTGGGEVTGMDGSFDQYVFVANGMRINTDAQAINLQVGDGTGYKTSGYQYHVGAMSAGSALYASYNSGSDTDIQIAGSMGNTSDEVMTFVLFIDNPASTTLKKLIHGTGCFLDNAGASIGITVTGNWNGGVTAITKVKVFPASGVIDSGKFYLYGIKKA